MDTLHMTVEGGMRASREELASLLEQLPLAVRGSSDLRLRAFMGLGRIVYMRCDEGRVSSVEAGRTDPIRIYAGGQQDESLTFWYKSQRYELEYLSSAFRIPPSSAVLSRHRRL